MIQIYRRHLAACKFKSRKNRACRCPIWAEGTVHGEKVRRSLDLTNWEAAVRLIREWEISKPEKTVSMSDACNKFVADAKARKLREGSILKYEQAVKTLRTIDKTVRQVTVEDIRTSGNRGVSRHSRCRNVWKPSGRFSSSAKTPASASEIRRKR